MRFSRNIICLFFFVPIILTLGACQSERFTYKGKKISEDRRIVIRNGGPHTGSWHVEKVKLNYEYTRQDDVFTISGATDLGGKKVIWSFTLNVNFADASGILLDSKNLAEAPYKQMVGKMPFELSVNLPQDAFYMSFSYAGTASGTGNSGSPNDFWVTP